MYWQGPCVVRGWAPEVEAEAVVLPADTTNAAAANAVMRARFILHTLQKIVRFRSGRSLGRGLPGALGDGAFLSHAGEPAAAT
ncbi:hypothetical protein ACWDU8_18345 [Streptomyces sp. NPDC003388]